LWQSLVFTEFVTISRKTTHDSRPEKDLPMTNPTPSTPVAHVTPSAIPAQDSKAPAAAIVAPAAVKPEAVVQSKV